METGLRSWIEIVAILCFHFSHVQADVSTTVSTGISSSKNSGTAEKYASFSTTPALKPVHPRITKVEPRYGPVSGGTEVIISGHDLTCVPDQLSVHLNLGVRKLTTDKCAKDNDVITCLTPPSSNAETGEFQLQVSCDTGNSSTRWMTNDTVVFTYRPDPIVTSVFPKESILSGGITQTVIGTNLDSVADPQMWTGFAPPSPGQGQRCFIYNSTLLKCRTQTNEVSSSNESVFTHPEEIDLDGRKVSIGFFFDGVTSYRKFAALRMFHDPEMDKFEPDPRDNLVNENKPLSIGVTWPRMNFTADDLRVQIGILTCTGALMDKNSITCYPPPLPKSVIRYGPSELNTLKVTVNVGHLKRDVGHLHYVSTEPFHVVMSVMIAILTFIFIVSCICGCCTFFGLQLDGCKGRDKKPPFRPISDAPKSGFDTNSGDDSNIKAIGKRRAKRIGASAAKGDKPIECVVMQSRCGDRDPL